MEERRPCFKTLKLIRRKPRNGGVGRLFAQSVSHPPPPTLAASWCPRLAQYSAGSFRRSESPRSQRYTDTSPSLRRLQPDLQSQSESSLTPSSSPSPPSHRLLSLLLFPTLRSVSSSSTSTGRPNDPSLEIVADRERRGVRPPATAPPTQETLPPATASRSGWSSDNVIVTVCSAAASTHRAERSLGASSKKLVNQLQAVRPSPKNEVRQPSILIACSMHSCSVDAVMSTVVVGHGAWDGSRRRRPSATGLNPTSQPFHRVSGAVVTSVSSAHCAMCSGGSVERCGRERLVDCDPGRSLTREPTPLLDTTNHLPQPARLRFKALPRSDHPFE